MALAAALASVLLALVAAPLVLGSGLVLRHADRRLHLLWLTLLVGLLTVGVVAGLVAVVLLLV